MHERWATEAEAGVAVTLGDVHDDGSARYTASATALAGTPHELAPQAGRAAGTRRAGAA